MKLLLPDAVMGALYLGVAALFADGFRRIFSSKTARSGNRHTALAVALGLALAIVDLGGIDLRMLAGLLVGGALGAAVGLWVGERALGVVQWFAVASALALVPGALGILRAGSVGSAVEVVRLIAAAAALALGAVVLVLASALALAGRAGQSRPVAARDRAALVALVNGCTGLAVATSGITLSNALLIVAGSLLGAASLVVAKTLGRSGLGLLVLGLLGLERRSADPDARYANVRSTSIEDAGVLLEDAADVVLVPGYGLAVAQAQQALRELGALLIKRGCRVRYAVHPFAGRMPGHLNVLLSEANVPYDRLVELEAINPELGRVDVVLVVGANDIVNAAASRLVGSRLHGVPMLEVEKARNVIVIKRSLAEGHEGLKNPLFEAENTSMLYGDAKQVLQALSSELKASGLSHAA